MEKTGQIQIKVKGRKGNFDLNPDNYDIRELAEVLSHIENLLFPNSKKDRPGIFYDMQEGSVRHVFKTSLQAVIGFNALLAQIKAENYSIDFLDHQTAKAFEFFQEDARKNNFEYEIGTSISEDTKVLIHKDTRLVRTEEIWADAEFYFYGVIVDAGGKGVANIHLDTKEFGLLKIAASKTLLANYENNPLYKHYGVRAKGKQNTETGEIDKGSLELLDIIDYNPTFNEDYINALIHKARNSWADVHDADDWLQNVRGYGA